MTYKSYLVKLLDLDKPDEIKTTGVTCTEEVAKVFVNRINNGQVLGEAPMGPIFYSPEWKAMEISERFSRVQWIDLSRACIVFSAAYLEDHGLYATVTAYGRYAQRVEEIFEKQQKKGLSIRDLLSYRCLSENNPGLVEIKTIFTFDLTFDGFWSTGGDTHEVSGQVQA